jgi:hypothetical protein
MEKSYFSGILKKDHQVGEKSCWIDVRRSMESRGKGPLLSNPSRSSKNRIPESYLILKNGGSIWQRKKY